MVLNFVIKNFETYPLTLNRILNYNALIKILNNNKKFIG
jgi:hypothetical protein